MNWRLFVAKRIYSSNEGRKEVSKPAVRIAISGIAVGMAIMIVSIAVVIGFKNEVRKKVISLGSDIHVTNFDAQRTYESSPIVTSDSIMQLVRHTPGVKHVQRYSTKPGMIMSDDNFLGMVLKGVGQEYDTEYLKNHLIAGEIPNFDDKKSSNNVIVSAYIADKLKLNVGDKIFTYYIDDNNVRARRLNVSAIYRTNFSSYDNLFLITDIHTVNRLCRWENSQSSGLEIAVKDYSKLDAIANNIRSKIDTNMDYYGGVYFTQTIEEITPQIFAWLSLLDTNVWVILILMMGVAGFTMISGLLIIILERTNMIGVLKALGATDGAIRTIFLNFSIFLIGKGLFWGNLVGLSLCAVQYYFKVFKLDPINYYIEYVPIEFNWIYYILLNIAALIVSVLMLVGPSYLISSIHPAKSIRFE